MLNCRAIEPLVTPLVDGDLPGADRQGVDEHLQACAPCRQRVEAERAVHDLIAERRAALLSERAPDALREQCGGLFRLTADATKTERSFRLKPEATKTVRWAPFALAASLVLTVGAAFLYQFTARSSRLMAAELTADHVKCFAMNAVLRTHHAQEQVERSLAATFGVPIRLPGEPETEGLELIGSRPCLYGEGRVAHVMYRHNGQPVSIFILPNTVRTEEQLEVLGHEAIIWPAGDHTFVLIASEPQREVERLATFVHASLQ